MQKFLCILTAILIVLSVSGCSKNSENDISSAAETSFWPAQALEQAVWPTDSWSRSSPEQQGIDSGMLSRAEDKIKDNYPNVYSMLVIRNGYLVYEKYFNGMDKNDANPVFSVTKSVMSALTGIAVRDGLIGNIDQKVSAFLPEHFAQIDNPQKADITIKNVLTMTGGLESIDSDYVSYFRSPDWLDYVLEKPLDYTPGEKFVYNTGLTHFLSVIITETSGMSTKDFAYRNLFNKIGISPEWDTDSSGYNIGGFGLYMKPADMAKFGYLYLNNGLWDGTQVIPEAWVMESTQKQVTANDTADYGYLFWLETVRDTANNREYYTYRAAGSGGQYIMVIPELQMIAVITANDNGSSIDGADTLDLITDYVIPAVQ